MPKLLHAEQRRCSSKMDSLGIQFVDLVRKKLILGAARTVFNAGRSGTAPSTQSIILAQRRYLLSFWPSIRQSSA